MSRSIKGPTGKLVVDDGGTATGAGPVLFTHSLAGTAGHWTAQLDHARRSRRAVAFDLRGHGGSEPPRNGEYGITALADDIGAVADALGIERFTLVGHSMGAGVALAYAGAHPQRVVRLLLLDSIGDGTQIAAEAFEHLLAGLESSAYQETIESYWDTITGPNVGVRELLLHDLRATPRMTVVEGFKATMRFDPKPALASYRGPALAVVTPSNDFPFSIHRLKGGPPHRVIDGTGHWIQLDKPAEVNRILDNFPKEEKGEGRKEKGK
ncbi:MAG TPA: alpha/beta fold hydrolase [Gemmatimonadales bacterium]|jgi:pimeloyl-ACP methyl ester carboxylesterase